MRGFVHPLGPWPPARIGGGGAAPGDGGRGAPRPSGPRAPLPAPFQAWVRRARAAGGARGRGAARGAGARRTRARPRAPDGGSSGRRTADYTLFETPQGLVLLDRRAAHERVWYERLKEQFRSGGVPVQRLLLPVPIELNPVASADPDRQSRVPARPRAGDLRVRPELLPRRRASRLDGARGRRSLRARPCRRAARGPDARIGRGAWRATSSRGSRRRRPCGSRPGRERPRPWPLLRELFATSSPVSSPVGAPDLRRAQPRRAGQALPEIAPRLKFLRDRPTWRRESCIGRSDPFACRHHQRTPGTATRRRRSCGR